MTVATDKRLKSKEWRTSHLYKIKTKAQTFETFKRNEAQLHFQAHKHTRNIVLKSRQLGFTTDESIDTLDDVAFNRNFDALFIAQGLEQAKEIFENKIKLAWENFPLRNLYTDASDSARKLKIGFGKNKETGEELYSSIIVDNSGRSGTFARVHVSEFAKLCKQFPDRAREVVRGTFPAVPTHGRIDIESTAEEAAGLFYNMFWEAWDRGEPEHPTQFKAHFYNWQWDPEVQVTEPIDVPQDFRDYQAKHKLSDREISYYYLKFLGLAETERGSNWGNMKREYPTTPEEAFEGAGDKLFDAEMLAEQFQPLRAPVEAHNGLKIYKPYRKGHFYAMGVDVAEGVGKDSSTIVLIDFSTLKPEVVATYSSNLIAPDVLAFEIENLANKYEQPLVAVERNNHGHTTLAKLREIYPDRCIYQYDTSGKTPKFGWKTDLVSKPRMFFELNTAVNEELIALVSRSIVSEARRYDKNDLRIVRHKDDENTAHFDLLTACAIAFQMKDKITAYKRSQKRRAQQTRSSGNTRRGTGLYGV
jgi:hypothetical protein